jgi:hypothetical protein
MQKHLQTFEFNGYSAAPASTNYFIPAIISVPTGPFNQKRWERLCLTLELANYGKDG